MPGERTLQDTQWSLGTETYLKASRKAGGDAGLSAIALDVRRSLGDHLYLVGRAVSAVSGGAGAYSAGLIGVGVATRLDAPTGWNAGLEATLGAAGGGGVSSKGGAIAQPMAWLGHSLDGLGELALALGGVKSLHGDLASPVVDLRWSWAFGGP